jgi:hypothetical protein
VHGSAASFGILNYITKSNVGCLHDRWSGIEDSHDVRTILARIYDVFSQNGHRNCTYKSNYRDWNLKFQPPPLSTLLPPTSLYRHHHPVNPIHTPPTLLATTTTATSCNKRAQTTSDVVWAPGKFFFFSSRFFLSTNIFFIVF